MWHWSLLCVFLLVPLANSTGKLRKLVRQSEKNPVKIPIPWCCIPSIWQMSGSCAHKRARERRLRSSLFWEIYHLFGKLIWHFSLFFPWITTTFLAPISFEANPDTKRLYDDLLSNYNRLIRPVVNNTETLTVWLGLKLSQLIEVNLKNQVMTTNLWVKQVVITAIYCYYLLLMDFIKALVRLQVAMGSRGIRRSWTAVCAIWAHLGTGHCVVQQLGWQLWS